MFYAETIKKLFDHIKADPNISDSVKEQAKQLLKHLANMLYS
jgi:hypothetical protein